MITEAELISVAETLRRKPFIWDNTFANDGPKQCKFLKLKPPQGRYPGPYAAAAGWAFNPMNQAKLSRLVVHAAMKSISGGVTPEAAYDESLEINLGGPLRDILVRWNKTLLETGLDGMDAETKSRFRDELPAKDPCAAEIIEWLSGATLVGPECLTD